MSDAVEGLIKACKERGMTRRELMAALSAIAMSPRVIAQDAAATPIQTRTLNSATFAVSDVKRSVEFYQRLFGMPVQAYQGETAILRVGDGPQFLAVSPALGNPTGIINFGLTVENFNIDRLKATLTALGVKDVRVNMRGPDLGGGGQGAPQGTPELFFTDSNGFEVHLQHPSYGGGAGINGEVLRSVPRSATRPPVRVRSYSHMTFGGERAFYERVFGMRPQAMQGNTAMLRVGAGPAFLTGSATPPRAASATRPMVGHICLTIDNFDANKVMGILTDHGLEPIEYGGPPANLKAMTARVRLRQRAGNGGGPTHPLGTYELYFRDPDNIETQIQDVTYCGGSGANGQICP
jgi:catechol 2,3-dioxygenase-like lactoylglutathione lyase family enzyme